MKRVLTGIVAVPIVVGIVYYGSPLLFLLLVKVFLVLILGSMEVVMQVLQIHLEF